MSVDVETSPAAEALLVKDDKKLRRDLTDGAGPAIMLGAPGESLDRIPRLELRADG